MEYVPIFTLKMAQMLVNVPAPWSRRVYLKLRFVSGGWKPTFNWRAPHCTFPEKMIPLSMDAADYPTTG
jgi:hypothetical protein